MASLHVDIWKINHMHLPPVARRVLQQSDSATARSNGPPHRQTMFELDGSQMCCGSISVRDSQMWNDAIVCTTIGAKHGKALDQRSRQGDERFGWIGSKISGDRKPLDLPQREFERLHNTQRALRLAKDIGRNFVRRHEGKQNRDMRWHAQVRGGIKPAPKVRYC
ncbi:hypothetical protein BCEP4_500053 [Burkholderia cepacia]|nr:hypothetical protein BCEP4_500053 [Burkholderia cepacia]